jgi:serine/threonine protein kinase
VTPSDAAPLDAGESGSDRDGELARVLEGCLADLEAGRQPDAERLLAEHPALAGRLASALQALDLVHRGAAGAGLGGPPESAEPCGRLGDFDILREVGRGGMGVVYEAAQVSLGRRVALKVLPFAATLDPRQLQRFRMEAQAAALLHHPNIVPIYSVGCERGVHYYAMQYVEGQSLAEILAALAGPGGDGRPHAPPGTRPAGPLSKGATQPLAGLSTERSARGLGYFRSVARLGMQAALALEHAHQLGVVHRDVKPANLLVDVTGNLWVADFGLARLRSHAGLTLSGDTVGTLRYASPEQALAKRGLVDHRTDVYSLGSTLYEALTLRHAYPGEGRDEVLRQLALAEPAAPRRLDPRIPAPLETVVLKAMAREPERRYATAQELADDLGRFLEDKPVLAAPPGFRERASKWALRHRSVLLAAAAVVALMLPLLLTVSVRLWRQQAATQSALELARTHEEEARTQRALAETNFQKALGGLNELLLELENPRWNAVSGFKEAREELTRRGLQTIEELATQPGTDPAVRFQAARAYQRMAIVYLVDRQAEKAAKAHEKAVALLEGLRAEFPENSEYAAVLAGAHWMMGNWEHSFRHPDVSAAEYRRAVAAYEQALSFDRAGRLHNNLACLLCDAQDETVRDPARAVALARRAVELDPRQRAYWNTLGWAHYRAGDWQAARADLERSMELAGGGDANDWLALALVCWHQGARDEARSWYDRSARWLETHPVTDELYHARREAAELLGVP